MKLEYFDIYGNDDRKKLREFVNEHNVIDVKISATAVSLPGAAPVRRQERIFAIVLYDDQPATEQVKFFNASDYASDGGLDPMEKDINEFCTKHDVVKTDITNDQDDWEVAAVIYKTHKSN